jgi:hypothetical protein
MGCALRRGLLSAVPPAPLTPIPPTPPVLGDDATVADKDVAESADRSDIAAYDL